MELSPDAVRRALIFLEFATQQLGASECRIYVEVAFNAPRLGKRHFWGCRGGRVSLDPGVDGKATGWTPAVCVEGEYTAGDPVGKLNASVSLAPSGLSEGTLSLSGGKESQPQATTDYRNVEEVVSPLRQGRGVEWEIRVPKGYKLVAEYLRVELKLYADCTWRRLPSTGYVHVEPIGEGIFLESGEPLSDRKNIIAKYMLRKELGPLVDRIIFRSHSQSFEVSV